MTCQKCGSKDVYEVETKVIKITKYLSHGYSVEDVDTSIKYICEDCYEEVEEISFRRYLKNKNLYMSIK